MGRGRLVAASVSGLGARLAWTARKIRSKDRRYPFRRFSYDVRKKAVDRCFPWPGLGRHAELPTPVRNGVRELFLERASPAWTFDPSGIVEIASRIPASAKDRTIACADAIVQGRFDLIGHGPVTLDPVDWDHANLDDPAWTRDLNRLAAFEQLGFAFHYTTDERYAHMFVKLAGSWMEQNAARIGRIRWDTPFQVGRRINSWMWAFFLFLEWQGWSHAARRTYLRTLGLLAEYLHQTLEYHSPGNHILLEAKALALCGEAFPEFAGAHRWRSMAWAVLDRELGSQICGDGVHCERSTMYHRAIAGELAELWLFCERNGLSRAPRLGEVVSRMAEFQRWIDLGNGEYPLLGDSRARDSYYRFSAPAIVGARCGSFVPLEAGVADHSWWVAGRELSSVAGLAPEFEADARGFDEGGYFVSRSNGSRAPDVLVWDCGPMGYAANRNHAHADALSLVLSVAGEPLLVDPGVGGPRQNDAGRAMGQIRLYAAHWRDLRRTVAHNTVSVDGQDQAILAERRELWDPPVPRVSLWSTTAEFDVMRGCHDGYARFADPVLHDRLILASRRGYWIIVDYLAACDVHEVETRYHVAPGGTLEHGPGPSFRIRKHAAELVLAFFEAGETVGELVLHEEERLGELRDGVVERMPVICAARLGALPFILGTVLTRPDRGATVRSSLIEGLEARLEVQTLGDLDRLTIRMDVDPLAAGEEAVVDIQRLDADLAPIGRWTFRGRSRGNSRDDGRHGAAAEGIEWTRESLARTVRQ